MIKLLYLAGALVLAIALFSAAWIIVTSWVETPAYRVVEKDGAVELRDYPALRAAEVRKPGARDAAVRAAFRPLAGYIFAKQRDGEKIAMTAPVTQSPAERDPGWRVRFLMPDGYALEDLPAPEDAEIRLLEIPARRIAAIRFSGAWRDDLFSAKTADLERWIASRGLRATSSPIFAYYNDPFTPGVLRRNEVMIEIAAAPPSTGAGAARPESRP